MTKGMTVFYLLLTLVGGIAIIVSLVKIQWVQGDFWRERAADREAGLHTDPARRGNIYSSDGKILSTTVKECDLYLDLLDTVVLRKGKPLLNSKRDTVESGIPDSSYRRYLDTVCLMLAEVSSTHDAAYYRARIDNERSKEKPRRCLLIERSIPYSTWKAIRELPGWGIGVVKQVDGRSVERQVRAHIYGNMAETTIGFFNARSSVKYTGLEGTYDSLLRGQDGVFNRRRLTKGIWLPDEPRDGMGVPQRTDNDRMDTVILQHKVDGQSIVATIDTRFQDIAENSLRKALSQYGGTSGCAILMEMQTGYVLACANLVQDSLGQYRERHSTGEGRVAANVAVSHINEPGSTFKSVILTAMLDDETISIDTSMKVQAVYKNFGGKNGEIRDSHRKKDSLSVKEVMEESSNVGMCELGWKYYNNRRKDLVERVRKIFPFDVLHLDVNASEYKTHINNVEQSNRDFLNFCYGYSTVVSPMQLITFYNALGAGGRMVKPLFCRAIINGDRHTEIEPVVLKESICSPKTAALMKELLESVVERGTGDNIKNNTYGIAGKTGTAVHSYRDKRRYNGSFAGFFPSENPRYTCLVVIENSPAYGRQAALVFKAISDCVVAVDKELSNGAVKSAWPQLKADSTKALQRPILERGNQADMARAYEVLGQQYNTSDRTSYWVTYRDATDSLPACYVPFAPAEGRVPNCSGMSAKDAVALLQKSGYRARVKGYGKVASQQPRGGTVSKAGSMVVLNMK